MRLIQLFFHPPVWLTILSSLSISKLALAADPPTMMTVINSSGGQVLMASLMLFSVYLLLKAALGLFRSWKFWNKPRGGFLQNLRTSKAERRANQQSSLLEPPEVKKHLPSSVIQRLQELEEFKSIMTSEEYTYQKHLIISKYLDDQRNHIDCQDLPNISEVQNEMQSLMEARSQGLISQKTFEQKYLHCVNNLMKYKSERRGDC